jgi:hypothetical protein
MPLPASNILPGEGIRTCTCPYSLTRIGHRDCSLRSVVARGQFGSPSTESNACPNWLHAWTRSVCVFNKPSDSLLLLRILVTSTTQMILHLPRSQSQHVSTMPVTTLRSPLSFMYPNGFHISRIDDNNSKQMENQADRLRNRNLKHVMYSCISKIKHEHGYRFEQRSK